MQRQSCKGRSASKQIPCSCCLFLCLIRFDWIQTGRDDEKKLVKRQPLKRDVQPTNSDRAIQPTNSDGRISTKATYNGSWQWGIRSSKDAMRVVGQIANIGMKASTESICAEEDVLYCNFVDCKSVQERDQEKPKCACKAPRTTHAHVLDPLQNTGGHVAIVTWR